MKYRQLTTAAEAPCMPTMSNLKARLKIQKTVMEDFIRLTTHVDMPWELRQQTIGNIYMDIRSIKEEIYRLKQHKVKKSK